ncbi:hypothetical protein [Sinomicrobium sp.]
MDIVVEPHRQTILVQQRWKYDWQILVPVSSWTYDDKKEFHRRADELIWGQWSGKFIVRVEGNSDFATQFTDRDFTVNFDIKWVLSNEHWSVVVRKIPPGDFRTSHVKWGTRTMQLDTEDLILVERVKNGKSYFQYPVAHEFGHAAGNSVYATTHGDEYGSSSPFQLDRSSMMNVGNELRDRHSDYLIQQLNTMVPETSFRIYKVR